MKKAKKLIAAILCAATVMTVCVPLASAEEIAEETTVIQQTPQADSDGQDVDLPEELPEENGDETAVTDPTIPEEKKEETYTERLEYCVSEGKQNLAAGVGLIGAFLISPLLFVIPPIGVVAMVAGLPAGLASLFVGIGEIVASPLLAFFVDTDTGLLLF